MLPVSDLVEVARSRLSSAQAEARSPERFARPEARAPVVVWNVCVHCNMTCPHCYAAAAIRPSPKDLSREEALRLLGEMADCGVRIVIFSGGEPLLRSDLFELLTRARDLGMSPQLSTNGTLIDRQVADRLAAAGVRYVGVSLDGTEPFNDAYRGLAGGYQAALDGIRHAKAAGMRTGIRMTATKRNGGQLAQMLDLAESVAAERFYVSHLVYSGRGFRIAEEDLSRGEARALLLRLFEASETLLDRCRPLRIVTGSNDSDGAFLLRWLEGRYGEDAASRVERLLLERGGNSAGEKVLNVDHQGRVHPDQFWKAAVLGDVRKEAFATILDNPLREILRSRLDHLTGRCGACAYKRICRGSHRERALARDRDMWAPDPACVMEDAEIGWSEEAAGAQAGWSE